MDSEGYRYRCRAEEEDNAGKDNQAIHWYALGASYGDGLSMVRLGLLFSRSRYKNYELAVIWARRAIESGISDAAAIIMEVGKCYREGDGVKQDLTESVRLMLIAAESGFSLAQMVMGEYYRIGLGVSKNISLAKHWFRLAAAQDLKEAIDALAELGDEAEQDGARMRDPSSGSMGRKQALEVLELKQGATRAEIQEAHRRLIVKIHPDHGGSTFFAKLLNQAKEVLLR